MYSSRREHCEPLQITVDSIPADVAREIREVQIQDPNFIRQLLVFGATHRAVFEALSRTWTG
jgi:hypothetical protein